MKLITLGEAERDFAESVAYYEPKEPGLGRRFRDEVVAAVDRIRRNPELPRLGTRSAGDAVTRSRLRVELGALLEFFLLWKARSHFLISLRPDSHSFPPCRRR